MIHSLLLLAMLANGQPDAMDSRALDTLLRTWVHAGSVSFGITEQPAFRSTLVALAQVRLDTASTAARLAVWMNAHTVCAVQCAVSGERCAKDGGRRAEDGGRRAEDGGRRAEDGGRVQTLEQDSVEECAVPVVVAGRAYTLRQIRDSMLSMTGSALPVFWFASGSSLWPPFPNRAARADTVLALLKAQARRVCRSRSFVRYDPGDNVLQLPAFLMTYDSVITARHGGWVQFVLPYVEPLVAAELALRREGLRVVVTDRIETRRKRQGPLIKKL